MSSIKEILEDIYPISTLYTDTLQRKPHRPFCGICSEVIRLDFVATDEAWELSLHINDRAGYVCISCFSKQGDERGVDWSDGIKFYPLPKIKQLLNPSSALAQTKKLIEDEDMVSIDFYNWLRGFKGHSEDRPYVARELAQLHKEYKTNGLKSIGGSEPQRQRVKRIMEVAKLIEQPKGVSPGEGDKE